MSLMDAIVVIILCGIVGFLLGMAIPEPAGQIANGFLGAIVGVGITGIILVIYFHIRGRNHA